MKISKHTGAIHIKPYCCAQKHVGNGKYKKTNWLWLSWMICLDCK